MYNIKFENHLIFSIYVGPGTQEYPDRALVAQLGRGHERCDKGLPSTSRVRAK